MNNDDKLDNFENFLASQPLHSIPPDLRAKIITGAKSGSLNPSEPAHSPAPEWSWWHALLWPGPIAWGGLACIWVLIIGMNFAARPTTGGIVAVTPPAASPAAIVAAINQQRQLIQNLSQFDLQPAALPRQPRSPGAFYRRRDPSETEIT